MRDLGVNVCISLRLMATLRASTFSPLEILTLKTSSELFPRIQQLMSRSEWDIVEVGSWESIAKEELELMAELHVEGAR